MIRRFIRRVVRWANEEVEVHANKVAIGYDQPRASSDINTESMTFRLFPAQGGTVIEVTHTDNHHGRQNTKLYLIDERDDFTESISKIVTLERLKV